MSYNGFRLRFSYYLYISNLGVSMLIIITFQKFRLPAMAFSSFFTALFIAIYPKQRGRGIVSVFIYLSESRVSRGLCKRGLVLYKWISICLPWPGLLISLLPRKWPSGTNGHKRESKPAFYPVGVWVHFSSATRFFFCSWLLFFISCFWSTFKDAEYQVGFAVFFRIFWWFVDTR